MSHNTTKKISTVISKLEEIIDEINNSEIPLPENAIWGILKIQRQAVELRDAGVLLHRESGWTLNEVGAAFEISPSRVSQLSWGKQISKTPRIRLKSSV